MSLFITAVSRAESQGKPLWTVLVEQQQVPPSLRSAGTGKLGHVAFSVFLKVSHPGENKKMTLFF